MQDVRLRTRVVTAFRTVDRVGSGVVAGLEPALGVDGGHAAGAGGGDGLAVDVVLDVAAGEDAVDVGGGRPGAAVTR